MTILPLSAGTFKAPAHGHLMWVVNTSEKVWNNFKDEYKYKVQYSLGLPKAIDIPAPAVEIVQVGGRHGVWEAKFDLKEYKPPAGFKPHEFSPSIFASEGPNDPMVKFDQSYRTPFAVQSRMGLASGYLPPGMELYLRVASKYEIVSPPTQVKAPKSFTCKVYELLWTGQDAPKKADGFTPNGYGKANDPDAVIAVREGQTITLSVEGGEWNLFTVQGGPSCTSEGLTADQMKTWVESIKGKVKNPEALRMLESGEFGRIPGVRMGALVAQFYAQKDAGVDLTVLGKGTITLKAPCDGTLRLRPNYLNYYVESDLKRAGVAERVERGPGLSVRVTVD